MLTRQQHDLLVFIDRFTRENGWAPSYEEMRVAMGFANGKSGVHRLVKSLVDRKFITQRPNRARAIEVIRMPGDVGPKSDAAAVRQIAIAALEHRLSRYVVPPTLPAGILDALDGAGLMLVRKP